MSMFMPATSLYLTTLPHNTVQSLSLTASATLQDFPELGVIRQLLAQKFGKEFVAEAADDSICRKWQVNENLRRYCIRQIPLLLPNDILLPYIMLHASAVHEAE